MNFLQKEAKHFCSEFTKLLRLNLLQGADIGIAPPFTAMNTVFRAFANAGFDNFVAVGAQNVHWNERGAHTGEISAPMLKECGAQFVIVGHSERRLFYGETSDKVALRALAAIHNDMTPVVCVGESPDEFQTKQTAQVLEQQLVKSLHGLSPQDSKRFIIAYEPVWAIGTGLAATPGIIDEVHSLIYEVLAGLFGKKLAEGVRIIYGGSTNPENIGSLMNSKYVSGALIGGASLQPETFFKLIVAGVEVKSTRH